MKELENNAAELFRLMDRVRKAWQLSLIHI